MGEMLLPLFAVMALLTGLSQGPWAPLSAAPEALGAVLVYLAFGYVTSRAAVAHWRREHVTNPMAPFRITGLLHLGHLLAFVALCVATPWLPWLRGVTQDLPGVTHLLGFAPYVAFRAVRCRAEFTTISRGGWSVGSYTVFHLRVLALPVLPILLVMVVIDILLTWPGLGDVLQAHEPVSLPVGMCLLFLFVFAGSPALIRWILGARPLASGSLRDRLEAYGQRSGFKPNDILVWDTRGSVSNALFIGVLPWFKYVVVTDALMQQLDEEAVEAVYAHEAGHGARGHTLFFLGMSMAFMFLGSCVSFEAMGFLSRAQLGAGSAGGGDGGSGVLLISLLSQGISLLLFAAFFLGGLGWISRRFETEADLHAVLTLEEPDNFPRALAAVGLHMGILHQRGFRHFGIGRRLGLINRYRGERDYRRHFDRVLRLCRLGILSVLGLSLVWFLLQLPTRLALGELRLAYEETRASSDRQELATLAAAAHGARSNFWIGFEASQIEVAAWAAAGDAALQQDDEAGAQEALERMRASVGSADVVGVFNVANLEVLLEALAGKATPSRVRSVQAHLERLARLADLHDASLHETRSDLFLAERAVGGKGALSGDPGRYSPAARLLHAWQSGRPLASELRKQASDDLKTSAFRRRLFLAATEGKTPEDLTPRP